MATTVSEICSAFLDGFHERIEYAIVRNGHVERRIENRNQTPLLTQLIEAHYTVPVTGRSCESSATKTKPPLPGNLAQADAIMSDLRRACTEACAVAEVRVLAPTQNQRLEAMLAGLAAWESFGDHRDTLTVAEALSGPHRDARRFLGYGNDLSLPIHGSVCGPCGGALYIDRSSTDLGVHCRSCPNVVGLAAWIKIAEGLDLVDTTKAVWWLRRAAGGGDVRLIRMAVYRWGDQGIIVKHGTDRRGQRRWDLGEIQRAAESYYDKHGKFPWAVDR